MNRNARILKEEGDKENKIGNIAPWMDGWPSERKEHYCIAPFGSNAAFYGYDVWLTQSYHQSFPPSHLFSMSSGFIGQEGWYG